jgi:hypothetical protein
MIADAAERDQCDDEPKTKDQKMRVYEDIHPPKVSHKTLGGTADGGRSSLVSIQIVISRVHIVFMHAHVLPKVIMPTEILATTGVRATVGYK